MEGSKDLADDPPVFEEGARVNEDIIHIAYHLTIVDDILIYSCTHFKHWWISWFKQPSVSLECSLPLVVFLDLHIIESPVEIKYGEELSIMEAG